MSKKTHYVSLQRTVGFAVEGDNLCLFWESYKTHKYKMQSFLLLNQVVYI
jgi:hypothetical protein